LIDLGRRYNVAMFPHLNSAFYSIKQAELATKVCDSGFMIEPAGRFLVFANVFNF
jgi:hypothetical protein